MHLRRYGAVENGGVAMGAVLCGRYTVGRFEARLGEECVYIGLDGETGRTVRLMVAPMAGRARSEVLCHAETLFTLRDADVLAVPDAVRTDGEMIVGVFDAPNIPLLQGARTLDDDALLRTLCHLTDALLILHSLGTADGCAVHGAPSAACLRTDTRGDARLLLPLLPHTGDPVSDIRGFGAVLKAHADAPSPPMLAILERMCAGGYDSALAVKHELNWL